MPKSVLDICPNIQANKDGEVLLFVGYQCVEHYPYGRNSMLINKLFCDVCDQLGVTLPLGCSYAYYRFDDHGTTTVKQVGMYSYIINSKIRYPQNEQNSKTRG